MTSPKVWFITGASSGFGRAVTEQALKNGDIVVATLRKPTALTDLASVYPDTRLLVLPLEVRDNDAIRVAFKSATDKFGRIDVVFNNAGFAFLCEAEGMGEENGRKMFDVNFWAATNVTLEAVRVMREVNSPRGGLILQNSSENAIGMFTLTAHYNATKAALEAFSRGLAADLDPAWNIKFTFVEPGSFQTNIMDNSLLLPQHPAYATSPAPSALRNLLADVSFAFSGSVAKASAVICRLASLPDPPMYFPLGKDAIFHSRTFVEKVKQDVETYASWSDDVET